jgi:hypothetical protein
MAVTVFSDLTLNNLVNVNRHFGECSASVFGVEGRAKKMESVQQRKMG